MDIRGATAVGNVLRRAAATGSEAAPGVAASQARDVIIIGGGVVGSTMAHDLARAGKTVHVVEKYAADAQRRNLLNLAPAVGDRLSALDGGTGEITRVLVPIQQFRFDDLVAGGTPRIRAGTEFSLEQNARPGLRGLMDGLVTPPEDPRLWSRVRIEEVEDSLRRYAERHYADKVTFHYDSTPTSINGVHLPGAGSALNPVGALADAQNGLLELLPKGRDGVEVVIRGKDGSEQALRGSFLVYATGGRNPLGLKADLSDDVMHFAGGEFPASPDPAVAHRVREWSDRIPGTAGRAVNSDRQPLTTIGLNYPKDKSIVWAQVGPEAKTIEPSQLKDVLRERAKLVGIKGELQGEPIPVKVQLGSVDRGAFADQRIILVGDELGPPYFPTSSGAAKGIAFSAPLASDALVDALKPGADVGAIFQRYEREALEGHRAVLRMSEQQVHHDLKGVGSRQLPFDLPRTRATA